MRGIALVLLLGVPGVTARCGGEWANSVGIVAECKHEAALRQLNALQTTGDAVCSTRQKKFTGKTRCREGKLQFECVK